MIQFKYIKFFLFASHFIVMNQIIDMKCFVEAYE